MDPGRGDLGEKFSVGSQEFGEGQPGEVVGLDGGAGLEVEGVLPGALGPGGGVDVVDEEEDFGAGRRIDVVQDLGDGTDVEGAGGGAPLFEQFAGQGGAGGLSGLDLTAGQLEAAGAVGGVGRAALDEQALGAEPDEAGDDDEPGLHAAVVPHPGRSEKLRLSSAHPMRLYSSKISTIVEAIYKALVDAGDLEVSDKEEFKRDVVSILNEYRRKDRELTDRAKDQLEQRKLPYSDLYKVKRTLSEEQDFGIGDESVNWIANQLVELFMQSKFVSEIFAEDSTIRKKLREILRRHMQADEDLDREVRRHLKHLNENTSTFEIEYQRQLELIKRKHGLD
jgi:hypothetical protein